MLFKKIFGNKKEKEHNFNIKVEMVQSTPYIPKTKPKQELLLDRNNLNNVLVLWWISKKKNGYEYLSNKFPKWFENSYAISFNLVMEMYIEEECLENIDNIVRITEKGTNYLKENQFVPYIHEHNYDLSIEDFTSSPNLNKISNNDIAWSVFNKRILEYTSDKMWEDLAINYSRMAYLLIEEKRYEQALDYIFASAYIQTSGMENENKLKPLSEEKTSTKRGNVKIEFLEIDNYWVTAPFLKINKALEFEYKEIKKRYIKSSLVNMLEQILPFKYFEKEEAYVIFEQAVKAGRKSGIFDLNEVSKILKYNEPDKKSTYYFYNSIENILNY